MEKSRNQNSPRYRRIRIYSTIAFIITKFSQKLRNCISSNIPEVFCLYFRYFVALANLIKIYKDSFKGQTSSLNCVRWGIWRESVWTVEYQGRKRGAALSSSLDCADSRNNNTPNWPQSCSPACWIPFLPVCRGGAGGLPRV